MKSTTILKAFGASFLMLACVTHAGAQGAINTIAGSGTAGIGGDGGAAVAAQLSYPTGVAVDNATGLIYIADKNNHKVRVIDPSTGVINTFAGTGTMGYAGMGGPAASANLEYPNAIYVDAAGDVHFSDGYADAAFKVHGGSIHNTCGHGSQGCTGDGGPGPMGTMCIPMGIHGDDDGNIYICDIGNNRIRKVDGATGVVTTFTGGAWGLSANGSYATGASYNGINGVCTDHNAIYVSDKGNHIVYRIDRTTGIMRIIAGTPGVAGYSGDGGMAMAAKLNQPGAMYVHNNYLFICDPAAHVVRVVNLSTGVIATLAGNGTAGFSGDGGTPTTARLNQPSGIWEDASGTIYIADAGNNRIRTITGAAYKGATAVNTVADGQMQVFPNPTQGEFSIQLNEAATGTAEVYNIAGVLIHTQQLDGATTKIGLNQPAGIYMLKVNTGNGSLTQAITIAR